MRALAGKPLLQWTVDAAKDSNLVTRVVVSSEDQEILQWCHDNDVEYVSRPPELAADDVWSAPVVLHALDGSDAQYVVLLHPTSPFRTAEQIDEAVAKCIGIKGISVISVTGDELNGAIYVSDTERFRRHGTFFAPLIWPYVMDAHTGLDIDTPADWTEAESAA